MAILIIAGLTGSAQAADLPRERLLMDFGWKFHLGDLGFQENIITAVVIRTGLQLMHRDWVRLTTMIGAPATRFMPKVFVRCPRRLG